MDVNQIVGIRSFDLSKIVSDLDPEFMEAMKEEDATAHGDHKCDDKCDKEKGHHHDHTCGESCDHDHAHDRDHKCGESCDHDHAHDHDHKHAGGGHGKAKKHNHDQRVSSVGVVVEGEINADRLDEWWRTLMETKAKSIYRSKGIIAMEGSPTKMVFQVCATAVLDSVPLSKA